MYDNHINLNEKKSVSKRKARSLYLKEIANILHLYNVMLSIVVLGCCSNVTSVKSSNVTFMATLQCTVLCANVQLTDM